MEMVANSDFNIRIYPSWVRYFKSKGVKFVRLTYQTYEIDEDGEEIPTCGMSKIEMAFGTMLNGLTYVMSIYEYNRSKGIIHNIIPFTECEEE